MTLRVVVLLMVIACLSVRAGVLHAEGDGVNAKPPAPEALARAILAGGEEDRARAAGWLASMDEVQILAVIEAVRAMRHRPASDGTDIRVAARVLDGRLPADQVRVSFRAAVSGNAGGGAREVFAALVRGGAAAVSNADGSFLVELRAGEYQVHVQRVGQSALYSEAIVLDRSYSAADPFMIHMGGGQATVSVQDALGRPCPGFWVDGWREAKPRWIAERVRTDDQGLAHFKGLLDGNWTFRAESEGGAVSPQVAMVAVLDGPEARTSLRLPTFGRLRVEGVIARRVPQGRAVVTARRSGEQIFLSASPAGIVDVLLPVGEWRLDLHGTVRDIEMRAGETTVVKQSEEPPR